MIIRFLMTATLIISSLLVVSILAHWAWVSPTAQAAEVSTAKKGKTSSIENSPNAITRGMFKGADGLEQAVSTAEQAVLNTVRSAASTIASTSSSGAKLAVHGTGKGISFAAQGAGNTLSFIADGTGDVFSTITRTQVVGALIRPSDSINTQVPVIGDDIGEFVDNGSVLAAEEEDKLTTAHSPNDSEGSWPIKGVITTQFGVPHWPWQETHTGIDISSQQPYGSTPIKPFKPGQVIETVRSSAGLGNYVIVNHGEDLTSVYAHLASISVRIGQEVNKTTTLGYEGSTGASTGTHLHFEIRLNGQSVNPFQYIDGQP